MSLVFYIVPSFLEALNRGRSGNRVLAPVIYRRKAFQPLRLRAGLMDHVVQIDHSVHETVAPYEVTRYKIAIGWPRSQLGQPITKGDIQNYEETLDLSRLDSGVLLRLQMAYNCTLIFSGHTVMMESDGSGHPAGPKDLISSPAKPKKASFREGTGVREASWVLLVDSMEGKKTYGALEQFDPRAPFAPLERIGR